MQQRDDRGRLVCAALVVLSCFASSGESNGSWSRFVPVSAPEPSRLGTAGRPFAWSTAIGDLNGDGTLDYAVADRIGRGAAGYEYSVDLSISGSAAQHVTFSSPDAALSITLRDVDHDHDLDVVFSTVVSPSIVRVWLNDGSGAFAEASTVGTINWRAASSLVPDSDGTTLTGIASTTRRARDALGLAGERSIRFDLNRLSAADGALPAASHPSDARRSRAPPAAVSLFL